MTEDTSTLTREQREFLEESLLEFANRYTDADENYKKASEQGIPPPPIINPWYGRPRLTAYRSGNKNNRNRYDRNDRNRYDNRYNNRDYERNERNQYNNSRNDRY